jgi:hypothetical protein
MAVMETTLARDSVYWEAATGLRAEEGDAVTDTCFSWKVTWPDLHGATERMMPIDGGVVWETAWEGTATGPFATPDGRTLPPSGKPIHNPGCMIVMVQNGKIAEMRHYFDLLIALRSAGAVPD